MADGEPGSGDMKKYMVNCSNVYHLKQSQFS